MEGSGSAFAWVWLGTWGGISVAGPVLAGFVWEGNVLQCLPEAMWVGRAWLPTQLLQGPGTQCFPLHFFFSSPPWFSWLPNEHSDSCLLEERRSSLGIV